MSIVSYDHLLISRKSSRSLVLPLRRTPSIWARKLWSPLQVNSIIILGCSVSFDSLCNRWKQVWICWWEPYVADLMTSIVHVLSYILKFSFWWHWQYGANTTRHSIVYDDYLQSSLCLCKCFFFHSAGCVTGFSQQPLIPFLNLSSFLTTTVNNWVTWLR